jgi:hypothetical protein
MANRDVSFKIIFNIAAPALLLNGDLQNSLFPCIVSLCSLKSKLKLPRSCTVAAPMVVTIQTALLGLYGGSACQAAFAAVGTTANATCLLFNFLVDGISAKVAFTAHGHTSLA